MEEGDRVQEREGLAGEGVQVIELRYKNMDKLSAVDFEERETDSFSAEVGESEVIGEGEVVGGAEPEEEQEEGDDLWQKEISGRSKRKVSREKERMMGKRVDKKEAGLDGHLITDGSRTQESLTRPLHWPHSEESKEEEKEEEEEEEEEEEKEEKEEEEVEKEEVEV